jgi:HEAT repeat protein
MSTIDGQPEGARSRAGSGRESVIETLLNGPAGLLWALAADYSLPADIQPLVAKALIRGVGLEKLRRRASSGTGWRRVAALRALTLGDGDAAWSLLSQALRDGSSTVGGATVTLLGQTHHRLAAELLADALRAGRQPRSRIATALERFPRPIPDVVSPLLWSDDAHVRFWGVTLMRRYPSTPGLSDRLEALTSDTSSLVRKAALVTLAEVGNGLGVGAARRCLGDEVPYVRAHAARTLGVLEGVSSAGAIGTLLSDRNWWVRLAARQTLESMGADVAPWVVPLLVHPDRFARNCAAEVLQNVGVYEQLLIEEATGPVDRYRRDVLLLLGEAGGPQMWNSRTGQLPRPAVPGRQPASHAPLT